ncbi:hypothetical protein [Paenibacillus sp.]|jgi:hypothetical protein|uniref:hypothetical protein n=1 Tax=Paenibacillus sp. TaxID=58172 RepID=UPI00281EBC1D|nr:hypothetical protein [Paenibacillus sp.]MDR0269017.1 hypothetical protein [Paenibacillus sp.]
MKMKSPEQLKSWSGLFDSNIYAKLTYEKHQSQISPAKYTKDGLAATSHNFKN